jgi:PTH1 family peptidyl-tRNA hydrolase
MKLILGLGNPERSYNGTFHNIGFAAVDRLAARVGADVSKKGFLSLYALVNANGERALIAKPQTYMNLSGNAAQALLDYYKLAPKDMTVIYDDCDLPLGSVRIRASGSAGTHNGMRNIVLCLGTEDFLRIRIGIGKPDITTPLADYVLSAIPAGHRAAMGEATEAAAAAAEAFMRGTAPDELIRLYQRNAE